MGLIGLIKDAVGIKSGGMDDKVSGEISEWYTIGSTPIRAGAPAGDPIRYDPLFDRLQAEMSKLEIPSGQAVDWKGVAELGREILSQKSKDLLVAAYLCRALLETRGYAGLAVGLSCMQGMLAGFWDSLYPEAKRMRARLNAIGWLAENVGAAVARKAPSPDEGKWVGACAERIGLVEKDLSERLGGESPGLGDLRRAVDERMREVVVEAPPPLPKPPEPVSSPSRPPETEESSESGPVASPAPPILGTIESKEDAERVYEEAGMLLRDAARFSRDLDPELAWPYQAVRALIWAPIQGVSGSDEGETPIPAPPSHLADQAALLIENSEWKELLNLAEAEFQEAPFWLDLHYFSALALTRLGPTYAAAKESLLGEVRTFLRRLPALVDCRFSDGTPFASQETRAWIEREVTLSSGESTAVPGEKGAETNGSGIRDVRDRANLHLGRGEVKEAIGVYHGKISESATHRDRFVLRLDLARLCLQAGYPRMALSQAEVLDRDLLRFSLEEWEPPLSLEALRLYWEVLVRLKQDANDDGSEWNRQADVVRARICKLDPVSALELEGG